MIEFLRFACGGSIKKAINEPLVESRGELDPDRD